MNLQASNIQYDDATNNYLSADYSKIIPNLTQIMKENKVANLSLMLSEQAINKMIEQLINAAL